MIEANRHLAIVVYSSTGSHYQDLFQYYKWCHHILERDVLILPTRTTGRDNLVVRYKVSK